MLSRRAFLTASAAAAASAALPRLARATNMTPPHSSGPLPIIGFSKPFQTLGAEETAALVAQVGWSGIEIPVRHGGQIEPARVRDELPRFVEQFQKRGLDIPVVVSDITTLREPTAEGVLRQAASLGIQRVRLGFYHYDTRQPILPQVERIVGELRDIGQLCGEVGIRAGIQNHSGHDNFGAPVWDVVQAITESSKHLGIFFDLAHATIEGGLGWPIQAQLVRPHLLGIYAKDFVWQRKAGKWDVNWVPLGEGMVANAYFRGLGGGGYSGPVVQHHEYALGDRVEMVRHLRQDLSTLQQWLGQSAPASPFL